MAGDLEDCEGDLECRSNIGEDASAVRHNLHVLAGSELPEKDRAAGRTEVLPVQWRKHLRLDVRLSCCFWVAALARLCPVLYVCICTAFLDPIWCCAS